MGGGYGYLMIVVGAGGVDYESVIKTVGCHGRTEEGFCRGTAANVAWQRGMMWVVLFIPLVFVSKDFFQERAWRHSGVISGVGIVYFQSQNVGMRRLRYTR